MYKKIHQKSTKKWWARPAKTLGQMLSQMKANVWAALPAIDTGFVQLVCHGSWRHFKAVITAAVSLSKRHQKPIKGSKKGHIFAFLHHAIFSFIFAQFMPKAQKLELTAWEAAPCIYCLLHRLSNE